jgi:hydroxypyruvate isomerase
VRTTALAQLTEEDEFAMAQDEFAQLIEFLRSRHSRELSHTELEVVLNERGRELLRVMLQAHVASRGPGPAAWPVCGVDEVERTERRLHERGLSTLFGEVRVKRLGYGAAGVESLHPLDAELNLPAGEYSLGVRRLAAEQAAQASFEATVQALAQQTGKTMGKRQVEELVQRSAVDFDAFYAQCSPEAEEASSSILALSADGKGVVMLPRDLREPTRKAAQGRAHKLTKRLSKGEKRNRKRMATVAAVYTVAPYERTPEQVIRSLAPLHEPAPARPPVEHKRVWASLEKTPEEVLEEAFREGLRRDPGRQKTWVGLVDGNATQLELLEALSRRHKVELTIVLDVMHVSEYLWDASVAFHEEASPQREQWVGERLHNVLRGNAAKVAAGMRRSATLRGLSAEQREPVDASARYLLNHQQYMRYDRYLAAGLPIGTGVIEGACRHLVCDRMDGAARWSLKGAEAVLRLRALRSSGDFEQYWSFHVAQEYQRNHVAHYANGDVVPVQGHSHPALRLVK